ncbi:MAG: (Fe-S)-binding protein [candidate division NC10 bacterium]|nr:(Fe-S)-binding protein [candidate division NC10 bacterium]
MAPTETVAEFQPLYDEVARCNRCGFCQPTCPIYRVTGKEGSVARGHHAHVRSVIEGRLDFTTDLKAPLFECLLCRACVANCFPAVKTHEVMVIARAAYISRFGQPRLERLLFHHILPYPSRMRKLIKLAALGKLTRLSHLARALEIFGWFGKRVARAEGLVESLPLRSLREELQERPISPEGPRGKIAYFFSCGFDLVMPQVGWSTLRLLQRAGYGVQFFDNYCCGLPPHSYGDLEAASHLARQNLAAFGQAEVKAILTDCSSCASFLKEYPKLLEKDPALREEARSFSEKVRDFSEFFHAEGLPQPLLPFPHPVTFHDPCHLSRYQGMAPLPRNLLKSVPQLEFREMPEADWCCGAAGTYHIAHPDQSMKVLERKLNHLEKTGAEILSTSCPSCMMQLSYGMRRRRQPGKVMHLAQILDAATSP